LRDWLRRGVGPPVPPDKAPPSLVRRRPGGWPAGFNSTERLPREKPRGYNASNSGTVYRAAFRAACGRGPRGRSHRSVGARVAYGSPSGMASSEHAEHRRCDHLPRPVPPRTPSAAESPPARSCQPLRRTHRAGRRATGSSGGVQGTRLLARWTPRRRPRQPPARTRELLRREATRHRRATLLTNPPAETCRYLVIEASHRWRSRLHHRITGEPQRTSWPARRKAANRTMR